jgi:hypothetical protein
VHSVGALQFKYATVAGVAGANPPTVLPSGMLVAPNLGTTALTSDWFVIAAKGDVDENGVFCTVITTSWNSTVYVDREGE